MIDFSQSDTVKKALSLRLFFSGHEFLFVQTERKPQLCFSPVAAVLQGSKPTILRNHIHNSDQNGILIHSKGRGEILHNEIFNNKIDGVPLSSFAE